MGQILIIWDKIFGTFQEELPDVKPVYGITRPVQTWNPIKINFQHLWLLCTDAIRTKKWGDKIRVWFMPTGWRPADVAEKYPVYKINDVYHFEKYHAKESKALLVWSWIQLFVLLLFVSYLFGNIAAIGSPHIYIYGLFIFLFVYAFTELMDDAKLALVWEIAKNVMAIGLIVWMGDWFESDQYAPLIKYILLGYFSLSSFVVAWIQQQQKKTGIENRLVVQ